MNVSDYFYDLPEELISKNPPVERGTSRLLVLDRHDDSIQDERYFNIPDLLNPGDVLVINNTKVIKARLFAKKDNGATREIVVLERHSFDNDWHEHKILYRRKISNGDKLHIDGSNVEIVVKEVLDNGVATVISSENLLDITDKYGTVPLPPYLHRDATKADVERYQTVWAEKEGSVAAPTASLNMTNDILKSIKNKGVTIKEITLHVGLGTFLPIRVENLSDHHMHQEYFNIPADTALAIRNAKKTGRRVVALGTTVTRALEYAADKVLSGNDDSAIAGEADIFIYPGYTFKCIDCLITNFHAPKSTVLMLAASFAGWDNLLNAYNHAASEKYSFLSYGDSMFIH
jgi:S-adenosylmethionine:tRNA ribosyltransferase-isomerase